MKVVVDRIEDEIIVAVTEEEKIVEIRKDEIDFEVKENDTLILENGKWTKNKEETVSRLEYMKKLTENMWKD